MATTTKKGTDEAQAAAPVHKIRITLTSLKVKSLERGAKLRSFVDERMLFAVCAELIRGAKSKVLKVAPCAAFNQALAYHNTQDALREGAQRLSHYAFCLSE